ncbi:MAG: kelch repeat-containing protein [Phycisphaerae bacterium]|nr:kelch repeat-containing protein [Phycisphaerae bacterium]
MLRTSLIALFCLMSAIPAPATTPAESAETGPTGPNTPPARWGTTAPDKLNNEVVWFGGVGGLSTTGRLGTCLFKEGQWKPLELGAPPADAVGRRDAAYRLRATYCSLSNRYYGSETAADRELIRGWLIDSKMPRPGEILDVGFLRGIRQEWVKQAMLVEQREPPVRCNAAMSYDDKTKKVVLFGGEGLFGVYNDTWLYDCKSRTWTLANPKLAPPPRCAHGMAARDGKVYVVGGQDANGSMSYCGPLWARLPFDVWCYDIEANTWTRLSAGEGKREPTTFQPPVKATISEDGKTLSWAADATSYGKVVKQFTGSLDLPGKDAGTATAATQPDTIQVRGNGFDPAWYEDVPPADPEKFAEFLKNLPVNKWVDVNPPKKHVNRDWGTTVIDPAHDQLLHWAGGHSSHCGTDVAHYSLATNRWHILYTPELPFEYCYSNDGAPVPTMSGAPWGPHSYLSYGLDSVSGLMIWTGRHAAYRLTNPCGTFMYDPGTYRWFVPPPQWTSEGFLDPERHKTLMAPTPHGVAVFADKYGGTGNASGLWLADVANRRYKAVAATQHDESRTFPPPAFGDRHGMTYDSKRDRVLIFHFGVKDKKKIWACDLNTRAVKVLEPKNSDKFPMGANYAREATYLPDDDAVLICTGVDKAAQRNLVYDCAADEWLEMPGAFAVDKTSRANPGYGVSTGIEWDAKRKLLWLVQTDGSVYAMRFDRKAAGLTPPAE